MGRITPERAQKRLEQAETDLAALDHRLAMAHGLGDTNRASGIEAIYQNNIDWRRERDRLRGIVEYYEDLVNHFENGGPRPQSPVPKTLGNYVPQ